MRIRSSTRLLFHLIFLSFLFTFPFPFQITLYTQRVSPFITVMSIFLFFNFYVLKSYQKKNMWMCLCQNFKWIKACKTHGKPLTNYTELRKFELRTTKITPQKASHMKVVMRETTKHNVCADTKHKINLKWHGKEDASVVWSWWRQCLRMSVVQQ